MDFTAIPSEIKEKIFLSDEPSLEMSEFAKKLMPYILEGMKELALKEKSDPSLNLDSKFLLNYQRSGETREREETNKCEKFSEKKKELLKKDEDSATSSNESTDTSASSASESSNNDAKKRRKLKLPSDKALPFYNDEDSKLSAENWIELLDEFADLNPDWTDEDKIRIMKMRFTNNPKAWLKQFLAKKQRSYKKVRRAFIKRFDTETRGDTALESVLKVKMEPTENVDKYATRFCKLIDKNPITLDSKLKKTLFINGLNGELQQNTQRASRHVKKLEDVIEIARAEELVLKKKIVETTDFFGRQVNAITQEGNSTNQQTSVQLTNNEVNFIRRMMKKTHHSHGRPQHNNNGQRNNNHRDVEKHKCYNCQGYGHFSRDCPSPKQKNGSGKARAAAKH